MKLLRLLLLPIVPIYWVVTWVRNRLYDNGIFSSRAYDFPLICIGNLSTGGTGKTPMVEYLINNLRANYRLAVLSRGYKRQSTGFVIAKDESSVTDLGDEPYQIYKKFPDILVAVDADRQHGIGKLRELSNSPQVILLDDAFQHRKVRAGINILLTPYNKPYINDISLPTGNLREPQSGAQRANIIIVTKCPLSLSESEKDIFKDRLNPRKGQGIYFSFINYSEEIHSNSKSLKLNHLKEQEFTLVTGIANPKPLVDHLKLKDFNFEHLKYNDHHNFSTSELEHLKTKSFILTTEKDYVRLKNSIPNNNLYYLPIEINIDKETLFNEEIVKFCESYSIGVAEL